MNMEAQATTGAAKSEGEEKRASFEADVARAAAIQQEIAEAAASGDFAKIGELSAEGQQLKSANESVVDADREEAEGMNAEFNAEKARAEEEAAKKAAQEAAAEQARFAQEAVGKAAVDQAAAEKLAEEIKGGVKTEQPKTNEERRKERNDLHSSFDASYLAADREKELHRGEAEVALSMGDIEGFKKAYAQMTEAAIARLELNIARTEQGIKNDIYPLVSDSDLSSIDAAQYWIKSSREEIEHLRKYSTEAVQEHPDRIIERDEFDASRDKIYVLRDMMKEATQYVNAAKKDGRDIKIVYPHATDKLEGAISAAIRYGDPDVLSFLKKTFASDTGLPMTNVELPSELQKQIADLKV